MTISPAGAFRALILSGLLLSCSSGSTGPSSGKLSVNLTSLHGDEGAVLFTVSGGPVESVEAVNGTVYSAQVDANTLRVVVAGNLSTGSIAHVRIPDVSQASHYTAAVTQVALRSTYALRDPGLYSMTLGR